MSALTVTLEVDTEKLSARLNTMGSDGFILSGLIIGILRSGAAGATAMSIMEGYGVHVAELLSTDVPLQPETPA